MKKNTIHLIYPILLVIQTVTSGAVDGPLFKVEVTAVDSAGQPIQGAEDGKVPEDFQYLPEERPAHGQGDQLAFGGVVFTYFFNPKANERKLEFDPKRNLLQNNETGSVEVQQADGPTAGRSAA